MAKVVEIMINACFESHVYKWDNKIRRQKVGGAIGLRAMGALAKITMDQWIELFAERLSSGS